MPLKVLDDVTLLEGRFVRLVRRNFLDTRGGAQHWEMIERKTHGPIVAVAAVTPAGALVINRIFRVPLKAYVLELPAGLMDKPGEQPAEVARRELLEETGYAADGFTPVMSGPMNTGLTGDILTIFGAHNARRVAEPELEPAEDIQVLELDAAQLAHALAHPPPDTLVDIKLWGILGWLQQQKPPARG